MCVCSDLFHFNPFQSISFCFILFRSVSFHSIPFHSILFRSVCACNDIQKIFLFISISISPSLPFRSGPFRESLHVCLFHSVSFHSISFRFVPYVHIIIWKYFFTLSLSQSVPFRGESLHVFDAQKGLFTRGSDFAFS